MHSSKTKLTHVFSPSSGIKSRYEFVNSICVFVQYIHIYLFVYFIMVGINIVIILIDNWFQMCTCTFVIFARFVPAAHLIRPAFIK